MYGLALALSWTAIFGIAERNLAEVDRLASELIELSTRHNFAYFLAVGAIYRGWVRSASGNTAEGIPWIEQGIRDFRAIGSVIGLPSHLARKAEALYLARPRDNTRGVVFRSGAREAPGLAPKTFIRRSSAVCAFKRSPDVYTLNLTPFLFAYRVPCFNCSTIALSHNPCSPPSAILRRFTPSNALEVCLCVAFFPP